jgi:hypothetical protein
MDNEFDCYHSSILRYAKKCTYKGTSACQLSAAPLIISPVALLLGVLGQNDQDADKDAEEVRKELRMYRTQNYFKILQQ